MLSRYGDRDWNRNCGFGRSCKPDSVRRPAWAIRMTISLGRRSPAASSDLPGSRYRVGPTRVAAARRPRPTAPLFGLAPGGVCQAESVTRSAGELLPHRFTLTPRHTRKRAAVCFLWHCPYPEIRAVGITHHHALRSPDFPLRAASRPLPCVKCRSDHPLRHEPTPLYVESPQQTRRKRTS